MEDRIYEEEGSGREGLEGERGLFLNPAMCTPEVSSISFHSSQLSETVWKKMHPFSKQRGISKTNPIEGGIDGNVF